MYVFKTFEFYVMNGVIKPATQSPYYLQIANNFA